MITRFRLLSSLLAAFIVTFACASMSFAQKDMPTGPLHFAVQFSQLQGVSVEVVDGFEWTTTLDLSSTTTRMAGRTTYPSITLRHVADGSSTVWDWYKNAAMLGKVDSTPGKIDLVDGNGNVVRTYTVPLLMPTRYRLINTPDGVVEELEVTTANPTMDIK